MSQTNLIFWDSHSPGNGQSQKNSLDSTLIDLFKQGKIHYNPAIFVGYPVFNHKVESLLLHLVDVEGAG